MKKSIDDRFKEFHQENPHIYSGLLRLALQFKEEGRGKIGISLLIEVLRWNTRIKTKTTESFKICNDFKPLYARLLVEKHPELKDLFVIKHMWRSDRG